MNGTADDQARAVVREAIDAANAHDTGRFLDGPSTFTFTVHDGKIELMRITA